MIDSELIKSKMSDLQEYYEELTPFLREESRRIIEDKSKLRNIERLFQLIADTAIDINTHIIAELNLHVPDDYQSTFMTLGEHKIFPMEFALTIAPSVGLRNMIVHRYGRVDIKKMVDDIKTNIGQYQEYARYISDFIKNVG